MQASAAAVGRPAPKPQDILVMFDEAVELSSQLLGHQQNEDNEEIQEDSDCISPLAWAAVAQKHRLA